MRGNDIRCACGCGRVILNPKKKKFATGACRMRDLRARQQVSRDSYASADEYSKRDSCSDSCKCCSDDEDCERAAFLREMGQRINERFREVSAQLRDRHKVYPADISALRRLVAKYIHPDRPGGNDEDMRTANALLDKVAGK